MSAWKRTAIATFPPGRTLGRVINEAQTPAVLWFDLWPMLNRQDCDTALRAAAFGYAAWCLRQANLTLQIMTLDGFYARLPEHPHVWTSSAGHLSCPDVAELKPVLQQRDPSQYAHLINVLQAAWATSSTTGDAIVPGQVDAIENAIAVQAEPWIRDCPNCAELQGYHGADLRDGERLPDAAYRLKKAGDLAQDGITHSQYLSSTGEILRCHLCGQFFDYTYDYEYGPCGGTTEFESVKRIPREEALAWCRRFPLHRTEPS